MFSVPCLVCLTTLDSALADHLQTEVRLFSDEEFVMECSRIRTSGDLTKAPSIQLASERRVFTCLGLRSFARVGLGVDIRTGLGEIFRKDSLGEFISL